MATPRTERYRPIADYGLIGDCHSTALVASDGSIDWCCLPRLDDPSCFGRLLDADRGGFFSLRPASPVRSVERRYLPRTLILETRFTVDTGILSLRDGFTMRPGGREEPLRLLFRVVEVLEGAVDVEAELHPRFDYGLVAALVGDHAERGYTLTGGDQGLHVFGDFPLRRVDHGLAGRITLRSGERRRLALRFHPPEDLDPGPPQPYPSGDLDDLVEQTARWWEAWTDRISEPWVGDERAVRSAIIVKALTNAPTGALAAAATTSLPEAPGGSRNWDYRYAWIRDSSWAVGTLSDLGCTAEATGFQRFVERSAAGDVDDLRIMYGLGGATRLPEQILDDLEGYRGARPVRVGNSAYRQVQLDLFGELLDLAWKAHARGRTPDADYARFLTAVVQRVEQEWRRPDQGLWEIRGEPRHHVYSKVMCWVAFDRAVRLAEAGVLAGPADRWRQARRALGDEVADRGVSATRGCFVQSYGSEEVDAALLRLPMVGFVPYDDPRMTATIDAIRQDLVEEGLVRRYRTGDGLGGTEGTFLACSFWLARCLAARGDEAGASEVFERASAAGNDVGLLSEEYDPATGEQLGNLPLAMTHTAQLQALLALGASAPGG